jgi:hypothetical protein
MKTALLAIFLGMAAATAEAAAQDTTHVIATPVINHGAVSLADFNQRLEADASGYLQKYPPGAISRFVEFDSAFPLDQPEYEAVGKFGIILLSAFSRDESELPLAGVYIGGINLKCVGFVRRNISPASDVSAAFGPFRVDSFCLVPANLLRGDTSISADFAKNRLGFNVGAGLEAPDFIRADADPKPAAEPDWTILKRIVVREYPGFGIEISP